MGNTGFPYNGQIRQVIALLMAKLLAIVRSGKAGEGMEMRGWM
jgi:hypothetical protein